MKGGPAASELEIFARLAVEDRLAAGDIPEMGLLEGSGRIIVRKEMKWAGLEIGAAAQRAGAGAEFDLVREIAIRERVQKTGVAVYFIIADHPEIIGQTASITLGTDVAVPRGSGPYLCCCAGKARFQRAEQGWTFVEWASEWCI